MKTYLVLLLSAVLLTSVFTAPIALAQPIAVEGSVAVEGELSTIEAQGLLYMREEEKLARDVYLTLYNKWNVPVFENIARSEQSHMDAIKTLLDRYGLQDPAAGQDVGAFANETLQSLYDQLVVQGSQSLVDALRVGAAIEEIDILDLDEYLAQTDKADILRVYQNLAKGSRNHLRAFVRNLQQQDEQSYQPQYLDQETYEDIVSTYVEQGNGRGGGRSRGKSRGKSRSN
jgi:hypothetical protein